MAPFGFTDDLTCGRCGQRIDGYSAASRQGKQVYYCHPDDENKPDCYVLSGRAGFPELPEKVVVAKTPASGVYDIVYLQEQVMEYLNRRPIVGSGYASGAF